jgi:hypothetical protein
MSVAFLLDSGVKVNTPELQMNPLQMASADRNLNMVDYLLTRGADINAPACPYGGVTALQAGLYSGYGIPVASFLLDKGAGTFVPPALLGGRTALESISQGFDYGKARRAICNRLLDANAPVDRPNEQPSSALHSVIRQGWHNILAQMLKPKHNAISTYMRFNEKCGGGYWESMTPTQLAAAYG